MPASGAERWLRAGFRQLRTLTSRCVDAVLGVETTFAEPLTTAIKRPAWALHRPTSWLTLFRIFRGLRVEPSDVLLDVGCGSGRVLWMAGFFPFHRILGLENSPELFRVARRNLERRPARHRARTEVVLADAASFVVPDDVTIVFLFNPFRGPTFERFVHNVVASLERVDRPLRIVYVNPVEHDLLVKTNRFSLRRQFGWRPRREWAEQVKTHVYGAGHDTAGVPDLAS